MKLKVLLIASILAVCVQGAVFAKGIIEERTTREYDALYEQVSACLDINDYASAIPLLKRMHELKPGELAVVEWLGILYMRFPGERPALNNALFWLTEVEKRGSSNTSVYYNLACIYSLKGEIEKAEAAMNKAIALGYSDFEWMSKDDDLANFRTGAWWKGIADNYSLIEQILTLFDEFASNEEEESITDKIEFYRGIITIFPQYKADLCFF